jgi:hypothetical protein
MDDADGVLTGGQTIHFTDHLLGLPRSRGGEIGRCPRLPVNLHLDLPGA